MQFFGDNPMVTRDQILALQTDNVATPGVPNLEVDASDPINSSLWQSLGISATPMGDVLPTYLK